MNNIISVYDKKRSVYYKDYQRFCDFCLRNSLPLNYKSLESYLSHSIIKENIKYSTFNRRLYGIKFFLKEQLHIMEPIDFKNNIHLLKRMYDNEFYELKNTKKKIIASEEEILKKINDFDLSIPRNIRRRAICLTQLDLSLKPSEIIRIKIGDIDFEHKTIQLTRKSEIIKRNLGSDTIKAIKNYMIAYDLKSYSYLVGALDRWGNYKNKIINERSYNRNIHEWLNLSPRNLSAAKN